MARDEGFWAERFRKYGPRTFEDPTKAGAAEYWIKWNEELFELIGVPESLKVRLETHFMLAGPRRWWEATKTVHGANLTWEEFLVLFNRQYFPRVIEMTKRREYYDLEQGSRTVTEYLEVFTDLGRYAPDAWREERFKAQDF